MFDGERGEHNARLFLLLKTQISSKLNQLNAKKLPIVDILQREWRMNEERIISLSE